MVDAADLKSAIAKAVYGFESRPRHSGIIDDSAASQRREALDCPLAWASSGPLARCPTLNCAWTYLDGMESAVTTV